MSALGPSGRLARAFVDAKLTPLLILASLLVGLFTLWRLPREEEPQIEVPFFDLFASLPGATPAEVERRLTVPLERLVAEIPNVEYVYSASSPGASLVVVRFFVGEDEEEAAVRLRSKLEAHRAELPPGASPPLVVPRSIDDVPVLALTLSSRRTDHAGLRRIAAELAEAIRQVPQVSEVRLFGGARRVAHVVLDADALAAHGLSPLEVAASLGEANERAPSGRLASLDEEILVEAGAWLETEGDLETVVLGASRGEPVFLRDVARIEIGPEELEAYVFHGRGAAAGPERAGEAPAVTISVAKQAGANAVAVNEAVLAKVAALRERILPADVEVTVSRDYGRTAKEKSDELLFHMLLAVGSVALLIGLALGRREAAIVLLAIPATLALTLSVFYVTGFTLNRITLFALIFSIGILVDDAIVVVENIARHRHLPENRERSLSELAVHAVDEVGNPTILATLAVIAAILPMAFVRGLMGPYMRPIPIGATAAMAFSLLVAFVVTPWATVRVLGRGGGVHGPAVESRSTRWYRRFMGGLVASARRRRLFLLGVVGALVFSVGLVAAGLVRVKMLPFDDKSELQVFVDMPEGTSLEGTARVARALAERLRGEPEVVDYQIYVGTAGPYTFSGLVRHDFLRRGANVAEIQVRLVDKGERAAASHDIARRLRRRLEPTARRLGARLKIVEVPPGPPVLQTLVAEVYGPHHEGRVALARRIRRAMEQTDGVVDVDWFVEEPQPKLRFAVDRERAALAGVGEDVVLETLSLAVDGRRVGWLHDEDEKELVPILLRLARPERSSVDRLRALRLAGRGGRLVPLGELTRVELVEEEPSRYRKNLLPVVYVTADVAGAAESPVYAILRLAPRIAGWRDEPFGVVEQYTAHAPFLDDRYAVKWDGEWHITYEVFRDLGLAFAAVLVLIYILVVAWFGSFKVPVVIMTAIPFSLVGILPAHALLGAFFTATSMIGFIAGAGIVVRNSIILVDFIELRRREGMPLAEAVVDAGAVRFRPMLLTAAAVVVAAAVILFDPIFQGLAISLMAGEIASLLLSRATVPLAYYLLERGGESSAPVSGSQGGEKEP